MCAQSFSHIWFFGILRTVALQVPLSTEFSRQGYWRGLPFSSRGDLPDPGIESMTSASPALAGGFFTTEASREPSVLKKLCLKARSSNDPLLWRTLKPKTIGFKLFQNLKYEVHRASRLKQNDYFPKQQILNYTSYKREPIVKTHRGIDQGIL